MRWLFTASLMAGLLVVPAVAQRGVAGGHAGGFSAPHGFSAPQFSAPHMSGGFSPGTHFSPPSVPRSNFSAPPQYHWSGATHPGGNQPARPPYGNWHAPTNGGQHRPGYPANRYRQPYLPYYYATSTYLVPGSLNSYWDSSDTSYSGDQYASSEAQGQVENNGDAENSGNAGPEPMPYQYQQADEIPPPPPGSPEPLPQAAVTLIFKDGHSQQIHNYALTKTTIYVLDDAASGRRPEIPLSLINVSATEEANQENGVDFVIPAGAE